MLAAALIAALATTSPSLTVDRRDLAHPQAGKLGVELLGGEGKDVVDVRVDTCPPEFIYCSLTLYERPRTAAPRVCSIRVVEFQIIGEGVWRPPARAQLDKPRISNEYRFVRDEGVCGSLHVFPLIKAETGEAVAKAAALLEHVVAATQASAALPFQVECNEEDSFRRCDPLPILRSFELPNGIRSVNTECLDNSNERSSPPCRELEVEGWRVQLRGDRPQSVTLWRLPPPPPA